MTKNARKSLLVECLAALVFFSSLSFLRVGDRDVRTANAIADDHPVVWAKYSKNPENWKGDSIQIQGEFFVNATLQNWLSSFLYRHFSFPPEWFTDLQVWFQNVGLGIALLLFCRFLDPRPLFYWTAATAVFISRPWMINLAYFPDVLYVPYAAHLVLPLLVLGLLGFLKNNQRFLLLTLLPAALIHPTQTIHLLMILFPTLLLSPSRKSQWSRYFVFFGVIGAVAVIPPLLLGAFRRGSGDLLTTQEFLPSLLANGHATPWTVAMVKDWVLPTILGFFFGALAVVWKEKRHELKPLLKGCAIASVVGAVAQGAGAFFGIPPLILLVPLRCTALVSVFLLPLLFVHGLRAFEKGNFGVRFSALLAISFQMYGGFGLFWGQWLVVLFGGRFKNQKTATICAVVWVSAFVFFGRPFRALGLEVTGQMLRSLLAPAGGFTSATFFATTLASAALAYGASRVKRVLPAVFASVAVLAITVQYRDGQNARSGFLYENFRLQRWAKENTEPRSLFMAMTRKSWRGISERPVVYVDVSRDTFIPYWRDRRLSELNRGIGEVFNRYGTDLDLMDEKSLTRLADNFGAQYLLRGAKSAPLSFPALFRNEAGVIYKIH